MDLKANASNNTVYADSEILPTGMVTLFLKDKKLNWSKVVDGTTSATEWKGLHEVSETVHLYNPSNGWLQNCNSTHTQLLAQKVQKRKIILHGA
jgi:acyl-homoserine lactone acylase PvdQ